MVALAHTETYAYFFEKIFGAKPDIELDLKKDEDGENINACITFENLLISLKISIYPMILI